jgi:hypothetical protein
LNLDALFLFITLARGFGALPAAKRGDFGLCQTEFIENSKKSAMPGESPQSHAMGAIGIVQTGILGFNAIQRTVESRGFNADFRNEIASNMSRERGWITGTRTRKSVVDYRGEGEGEGDGDAEDDFIDDKSLVKYLDGMHCFDQICTELEVSERELTARLKRYPGEVLIIHR